METSHTVLNFIPALFQHQFGVNIMHIIHPETDLFLYKSHQKQGHHHQHAFQKRQRRQKRGVQKVKKTHMGHLYTRKSSHCDNNPTLDSMVLSLQGKIGIP